MYSLNKGSLSVADTNGKPQDDLEPVELAFLLIAGGTVALLLTIVVPAIYYYPPFSAAPTPYYFYTGEGGPVAKALMLATIACAVACWIAAACGGRRIAAITGVLSAISAGIHTLAGLKFFVDFANRKKLVAAEGFFVACC